MKLEQRCFLNKISKKSFLQESHLNPLSYESYLVRKMIFKVLFECQKKAYFLSFHQAAQETLLKSDLFKAFSFHLTKLSFEISQNESLWLLTQQKRLTLPNN